MLLLIVLAAAVLVGVGAVMAHQGRIRTGPPIRGESGFSGSDLGPTPSGDDSAAPGLAGGGLIVHEQIQASHAAHSHHSGPHHTPDAPTDSSSVADAGFDPGQADSGGSGGGDA